MESVQPTQKIYYMQPYRRTLSTVVVEIIPHKKDFGIVLEQTIFYPEGGGQPGDTGLIDGKPVFNTILFQGKICHIMKSSISVGTAVSLELDWLRRYKFMQAHTAQHLISAIFLEKWQIPTVSIHFSDHTTSIDINQRDFDWAKLHTLEKEINTKIFQNEPINIAWYQTQEDLHDLPLRKLPKKRSEEGYRIVSIEAIDASPCGGIHVRTLGEIGIISFVKCTNITEGSRIEFVCGWRAVEFFQKNTSYLNQAKILLQTPAKDFVENLKRVLTERTELLEKTKKLETALAQYLQTQIENEGKQVGTGMIFTHVFENFANKQIREIMNNILAKKTDAVIMFANHNKTGKFSFLFGRNEEYLPEKLNMGRILKEITKKCNGNGGGRPHLAQGGGTMVDTTLFEQIWRENRENVEKIMQ